MTDKDNKNIIALRRFLQAITNRIGNQNLAIILMVTSNLLWPLGHLYVTVHHFSPFQTSLARGLSICLTHILLCRFFGIDLDFKNSHDLKYLFLRNSLILFHQVVYAGLYFIVPYPLVNSITITGPFFVFVIDYYINNITITKSQAIGILIGFTGVLVNINGEYIMSTIDPSFHFQSESQHYLVTDIKIKLLICLFAIFSNFLWGYAIVAQKKIRHVPSIKISYFLGLQFIFVSSIARNLGFAAPVTSQQFIFACIFSGLIMSTCQILFMSALNLSENTGKLTILILLYGVTSYLISFFRFSQKVNIIQVMGLVSMGFGLYKAVFHGK